MPCDRPRQMDDCMATMVSMFLSASEKKKQQQQEEEENRRQQLEEKQQQQQQQQPNQQQQQQDQQQQRHLKYSHHTPQACLFRSTNNETNHRHQQPQQQQQQLVINTSQNQQPQQCVAESIVYQSNGLGTTTSSSTSASTGAKRNSEPIEMDTSSQQKLYQRHFKRRHYSSNGNHGDHVAVAGDNVTHDSIMEVVAAGATTGTMAAKEGCDALVNGCSTVIDADPEEETCQWRSRRRPRNSVSECEMRDTSNEGKDDDEFDDNSSAELKFVESAPPKVEDEMIFELQQVDDATPETMENNVTATASASSSSDSQQHRQKQQQEVLQKQLVISNSSTFNANRELREAQACNGFEPTRRGLNGKNDVDDDEEEDEKQQQQRKREEELDELERLRVRREDDDEDGEDDEDDELDDVEVSSEVEDDDERELSGEVTVSNCERNVSAAAPLDNSSGRKSSSKNKTKNQQQLERKPAGKDDHNNTVSAVNLCDNISAARQQEQQQQQQQQKPQAQPQAQQQEQHPRPQQLLQIQQLQQQHQLILRMNNPVKVSCKFFSFAVVRRIDKDRPRSLRITH